MFDPDESYQAQMFCPRFNRSDRTKQSIKKCPLKIVKVWGLNCASTNLARSGYEIVPELSVTMFH